MKAKKDVLFLCQYFYPEYVSSATLPFDTAVAMSESGLSVGAICGYPKEYNNKGSVPLEETVCGIDIKRIRYIQLKRGSLLGRLINYLSFTAAIAVRLLLFREYRSIIVYSNPPILPLVAVLAKSLFGSKFVFVSYDVYPEIAYATGALSPSNLIARIMVLVNRLVYRKADKIVALSGDMKNFLLENRSELDHGRVQVISNWHADSYISGSAIEYDGKMRTEQRLTNGFVISHLGNLGVCQDAATIVDAMRILKNAGDITFLFAGHGSKLEDLRTFVTTEQVANVLVYDFLSGEDFRYANHVSDCFLVSLAPGLVGMAVPSKTYGYLMAGKPIIAVMGSNSSLGNELAESLTGFVVDNGASELLVEAILRLKNDQNLWCEMGVRGRAHYLANYTPESGTKEYVVMINALLGG